jgi:hypothetical protein
MLARFRFFDHGHGRYTAWLAPDPLDPWVELHEALVGAMREGDDTARCTGGFTPHLSVGQFRRRSRVREFVRERSRGWEPPSFEVGEVSFIERGDPPDDVFRLERTVPLGPPRG